MNMDTIRLQQNGPVATVTLARPQVHNAFSPTMIEELSNAFSSLARDEAVRVALLASQGKSFSAGADLDWMKESVAYTEAQNIQDAQRMAHMFQTLDAFPKPLVVRVQGAALGGGVGLVACGDVVVATERALLGFTEVRLGIIPAVISPYVVGKIGASQARRYFLTGERFDAATARRLGLVHKVVPAAQLDEAVAVQLEALLKGGPRAQAEAKALVRLVAGGDPGRLGEETAAHIARVRVGDEAQEGLRAFFEKRTPCWMEAHDA